MPVVKTHLAWELSREADPINEIVFDDCMVGTIYGLLLHIRIT